ncbi:MAG: hypothetical protein MUO52_01880 [Desulfobacterales bacterium]|nr:hypothetical protein [Desulfobacterales bacterium]
MAKLNDILIQRLEKKGVAPNLIPGLIRNIATAIEDGSYVSFNEVNDRLQMLGWEDFELDDHTLQLIIANLETDGSRGMDESVGYRGLG